MCFSESSRRSFLQQPASGSVKQEDRCHYGTGSYTTGTYRIETQRRFRCFLS